jgi:hypothetical protein
MKNLMLCFFPVLSLIITVSCNNASTTQPLTNSSPSFIEKGREYTSDFYSQRFTALINNFSDPMKGALDSSSLHSFYAQINEQMGSESLLCYEIVDSILQYTSYNRVVLFSKIPDTFFVQWTMADSFTIYGFQIQLLKIPNSFSSYQTKTNLHLPFNGEWTVFWGGRYTFQNYHTAVPNQYYAYDFVISQNKVSHTGDGASNEQYFCFNSPVLAPGAGRIIRVVNSIDDNVPGIMNPNFPAGNHVIIGHGNNEYSLLAHFKKGSITVNIDDSVFVGQEIGKCGNSGNSSEPHIHYHLQNSSQLSQGDGIPSQFQNYQANDSFITRGEPIKGQRISNVNP